MKNGKGTALALLMLFSVLFASCDTVPETSAPEISSEPIATTPTYTYNDYLEESPTVWSPFSWRTDEDEYILSLTTMGLYDFVLNESGDGYSLVPEMAETDPTDVTAQYAGDEKWGIPADATEGYAYTITLNSSACWEDGTPINGDTYLYSVQQLLDSSAKNYRASVFTTGALALVNGDEYYNNDKAGQPVYSDNLQSGVYVHPFETWVKGEDGVYTTAEGEKLVFVLDSPLSGMNGYSIQSWHTESGETDFASCLPALREKADKNGYVPVTDETIDLLYSFTGSKAWGREKKEELASYVYYGDGVYTYVPWNDVGFLKSGEYEITLILNKPVEVFYVKYALTDNFIVNKSLYEQDKVNYGKTADNYISYGPYKLVTYMDSRLFVFEKNTAFYGYTDGNHEGQYMTDTVNCTVITEKSEAVSAFLSGKLDKLLLSASDMEEYGDSKYILFTPEDFTSKLSFNGDIESLKARETEGINKSILAYKDFRKAISLCIDRTEFCLSCTATHQPGYGLYNYMYVSDPETGSLYRNDPHAKQALCEFYGVNNVAEITGYDLEQASALFVQAYERCLEDGNISETDLIHLELSVAKDNETNRKIVDFINNSINTALLGTVLEGKISITLKADADFYENSRYGNTDIIVSTWGGYSMSPYSLMEFYCVNEKHYEYGFDASLEMLSITIGEETVTKSYTDWYNALSAGEYSAADEDIRIYILSCLEKGILENYYTTPLYYRTSASLRGRKVIYATDEYVQNLAFGGIRYMTYVYDDAKWNVYIEESNYSFNY